MGALEVRAKSNFYELPKKEANRILSKCEQANRIEEAPFSASLSTDRGGNLEFHKMPAILASHFLNRNPRRHCQKLLFIRASLAVAKPASRAPKTAME